MTIHDIDAMRSEEMNELLHAILESEACDLETIGLVVDAQVVSS